MTRDPSEYVQRAAIQSLGEILKKIEGVYMTSDGLVLIAHDTKTWNASTALITGAVARLIQLTRDPDDWTRACAVAALEPLVYFIPPNRFEELAPLIWEQRTDIRRAAVEMMQHAPLGNDVARRALARARWDESPHIRSRATLALFPRDHKLAIEGLEALIGAARTDQMVLGEVVNLIAELNSIPSVSTEVIPVLLIALEHPNEALASNAAGVIGRHARGDLSVLPALTKALNDEGKWRSGGAAYALARIGKASTSAVPDLLNALSRGEPQVRSAALVALGETRTDDKRVISSARAMTKDDNREVRFAAVKALCRLSWEGSRKFCAVLGVSDPEKASVDSYLPPPKELLIPDD